MGIAPGLLIHLLSLKTSEIKTFHACNNSFVRSIIYRLSSLFFLKCWWRVCRHPHDQGPAVSHRSRPLGAPRHLQVLLFHRCHLLPFRPAELQDEVWILDVRPCQDRPGALWEHGGPEGGNAASSFLRWALSCFLLSCDLPRNTSAPRSFLLSAVRTCFVLLKDAHRTLRLLTF